MSVEGKLTGREKRVLTTTWVADAWDRVKKQTDVIKHSFKKYSLSNNADGSEDNLAIIKGTERYKMPLSEKEFQLVEAER